MEMHYERRNKKLHYGRLCMVGPLLESWQSGLAAMNMTQTFVTLLSVVMFSYNPFLPC
jgi:hypothetical protein